jgi:hypothetical protein
MIVEISKIRFDRKLFVLMRVAFLHRNNKWIVQANGLEGKRNLKME